MAENEDKRLEIDDMERDSFQHSCRSSASMVVQLLNHTLQNSGNDATLHQGIFRCFTSWLHVNHYQDTNITATELISTYKSEAGAM